MAEKEPAAATADTGVAANELRQFIERVERLEVEKNTAAEDIKDVYGEAKSRGFDVKVMRRLVALRKQDKNERQEFEAILDLYEQALAATPDLPFADHPLPVQRKGRAPRPIDGRIADDGTTISIAFTRDDGTRVTTPFADLATVQAAVDAVSSSQRRT